MGECLRLVRVAYRNRNSGVSFRPSLCTMISSADGEDSVFIVELDLIDGDN